MKNYISSFSGISFDCFWSKINSNNEIEYLSQLKQDDIDSYNEYAKKGDNTLYIYRNSKTGYNYVGQTGDIVGRNQQHFNGTEDRFNIHKFDEVIVVKSGLLKTTNAINYAENRGIEYFTTDSGKNTNGNPGHVVTDFKEKAEINEKILIPLWEKILFGELHWVKTPQLDTLRRDALFRYSPFKDLTDEQKKAIKKIEAEIKSGSLASIVVQGCAGTGKTVLVTNLVARILDMLEKGELRKDIKIGVVFDPNWLGYATSIFDTYACFNYTDNLDINSSTSLILDALKNNTKYDIIIVDESHKMSRRGGKQQGIMQTVYKNEYKDCQSHLEILMKMSKQVILMYDVFQAVRPSNIRRSEFKALTDGFIRIPLKQQMRIPRFEGKPYTPDDYINGIKYLLYKDTGLLDYDDTFDPNFNREVFHDLKESAYFSYYDGKEPLHDLFNFVERDRDRNYKHENRVLASMITDEDVIKYHIGDGRKKDADGNCLIKHWNEGDLHKPWNSTHQAWLKIKDPDKEDQIGCVYAVQGVDLDCAGVLICQDLKVIDGVLTADPDVMNNPNLVFNKEEREAMQDEFTILILSQYFVLLTRASYKVRLAFWKNKDFLNYMKNTLDIK